MSMVKRASFIIALALSILNQDMKAQDTGFNYFYRVYFKDKGTLATSGFSVSGVLSERAVKKREKAGIPYPDFRDLPVSAEYIQTIRSMGYTLHCTSKWMNSALFKTVGQANYQTLLNLSFVKEVKVVKQPGSKGLFNDKLYFPQEQDDMPPYDRQLTQINGISLHNAGFDGNGVLIAVLDGGFLYADQISSLAGLRTRKGIKGTHDFVDNNSTVYEAHTHGTAVMSVLAGDIEGRISGTAPGAGFLLLRTEDVATESSAEEDYWAAGAEYADSAGVDIISSSLGYCTFDDASSSYKFSDMDGHSTFITRVADIAASKGILVINSAGNERNKPWLRIIAPADGDSVLAVGAVDGNGVISSFSSAGPSFDRRVKPDNPAMGVSIVIQSSPAGVSRSSGTSFSCPVLSGMAACLKQAVPAATNSEIIRAFHEAGNRFNSPDSLYGYGIPDMAKALVMLQGLHLVFPGNESVITPNPTNGEFEIIFREPPENIHLEIFNPSGIKIYSRDFGNFAGRSLRINELMNREQGLYLVRVKTNINTFVNKVIKLRN